MNIAASLIIGAVTAVAPVTTTPLSWQDCGDGLQCAQIKVPVDWTRRSGPEVAIGLAKLPAQDPARKKGVLLVNTGGPGEQIALLRRVKQSFTDLTRWFDVVIFDPRGFGQSTAIKCPTPAPFATEWVFPDKGAYDAYAAKNRTFGKACRRGWRTVRKPQLLADRARHGGDQKGPRPSQADLPGQLARHRAGAGVRRVVPPQGRPDVPR
ncbi:hypothetical protein [Nonomuraea sp. NPDC049400]|uniref:hypothetical protein n=1 Tax=Nonomuraea sp. NPDC049400 TaxID=3364352 RepID=UPI0037A30E20